jgi:N-methylhydantoinase A/oxoprolinase/acetone carboxylase beta subunit
LALDLEAARAALGAAGLTAEGVIQVVDAAMERALRTVSVERGVDPRRLALVAFGGAGPLHACALADALDLAAVVVPARAGVLSAVGLLTAPLQRDLVRSWPTPTDPTGLAEALRALADDAAALIGAAATTTTSVDCRYAGQSHEITVATMADFHEAHRLRNGFARPDAAIEVIAIRATAAVPAPGSATPLLPPTRAPAVGPVAVAEADCTIWIPAGWAASPGVDGALVLRRERA